MANDIQLGKKYVDLVDELYSKASVTSVLNSNQEVVRAGAHAGEIVYAQVDVDGLGDYGRNEGYADGSVDVEWKTAQFNYDRGRKISVDSVDNQETFDIAFSHGLQETVKFAAIEGDAFTFATLSSIPGVSVASVDGETYVDGSEFLNALTTGMTQMDEDQVPEEGRHLFATPTLLNAVMALDTTKSREVLDSFASITKVPQSRFYTAITLNSGKDGDVGGFTKSDDGKDLNFMIVHKDAVIKGDKHIVSDLIAPDDNPDADAYIAKYRKYGIVDALRNKVAGIYVSYKEGGSSPAGGTRVRVNFQDTLGQPITGDISAVTLTVVDETESDIYGVLLQGGQACTNPLNTTIETIIPDGTPTKLSQMGMHGFGSYDCVVVNGSLEYTVTLSGMVNTRATVNFVDTDGNPYTDEVTGVSLDVVDAYSGQVYGQILSPDGSCQNQLTCDLGCILEEGTTVKCVQSGTCGEAEYTGTVRKDSVEFNVTIVNLPSLLTNIGFLSGGSGNYPYNGTISDTEIKILDKNTREVLATVVNADEVINELPIKRIVYGPFEEHMYVTVSFKRGSNDVVYSDTSIYKNPDGMLTFELKFRIV